MALTRQADGMRRDAYFNRIWYEGEPAGWWLRALSVIYIGVSALRRALYRIGVLRRVKLAVPVIVIGNLTAGGTGKTPLTLALIRELKDQGFKPGVISRGYGGKPGRTPLRVSSDTPVELAGDEPVLLAQRSGVPVCVHPRRARAGAFLLESSAVNVIVCDDGLQHYALARDFEIAVIDGLRGLGNGKRLPAGPLRESAGRLQRVDHVVVNGELSASAAQALQAGGRERFTTMRLRPVALVNVLTGERRAPDALSGRHCAALAGIGNPQRFFGALAELNYNAECRAFPDHYTYRPGDFAFAGDRPLLMTEKDAVKSRPFAAADWWYLEIAAILEDTFTDELTASLRAERSLLTGR